MQFDEREFFIAKIMSNYIIIRTKRGVLRLYIPDVGIIYEANELIQNLDKEALGMLSNDEILQVLFNRGLWSTAEEEQLEKVIPDNLEKLKIGLYESMFQSNKQNLIRQYIAKTNEECHRLYTKRHRYDHITFEGYKTYLKNFYIVSKSARYRDKRVNWTKFDINEIMVLYYQDILPSFIIRELARTTPWLAYWSTMKIEGKLFSSKSLTLNQLQLIQWSLNYESAHESMDCPLEEVFEDDDMFDGWVLIQRKKISTEKRKHIVESKVKASNADEVFIVADTLEDAKAINVLNDPQASMIKQARIKQIQNQGIVKEQNLADIKRDLFIKQNQAYITKARGGV